jgi:hypothetical protein
MRTACRIAGALALFSLLLWAFTGIPLWASVDEAPARGFAISVLHLIALMAGVASLDKSLWNSDD